MDTWRLTSNNVQVEVFGRDDGSVGLEMARLDDWPVVSIFTELTRDQVLGLASWLALENGWVLARPSLPTVPEP